MQVTTRISVDFPKLSWGINAGETRDLPEDAAAQEQILAHPDIIEVKSTESVKPRKERHAKTDE